MLVSVARPSAVVAFQDEPLRLVVNRMAETGLTRFPVLDSPDDRRLLGMISLEDLLKARAKHLDDEFRRERVLALRFVLPRFPGTRRPDGGGRRSRSV